MSTGWIIGWIVGGVVVLAVVALVTPILLLARRIGDQAARVNEPLGRTVANTAPLEGLNTTIGHAEVIVDGLGRGRTRLGG